jgi:hypothetical protein
LRACRAFDYLPTEGSDEHYRRGTTGETRWRIFFQPHLGKVLEVFMDDDGSTNGLSDPGFP